MSKAPSALSSEEVSALMAELNGAAAERDDGGPRPFALGQAAIQAGARFAGLERIGERLARRLRAAIEPLARAKVQVSDQPVETQRFEAWREGLPEFTSLSLYRMRPLKGGVLIAIEPQFVASMVDAFYGGTGLVQPRRTKEFTPTEDRLLARLADEIAERLVEVWAEVMELTPALASRETNAAYASLVRAEETVVIQRFTVVAGQGLPSVIAIVYPMTSLRPVFSQLATKVHDDAGPADPDWRARMAEALCDVRLPVRSVLARPELSVAQLLQLKVGDVIPISLAQHVPLIVANRRLASGTIGEQDGRVALMIEKVEGGRE